MALKSKGGEEKREQEERWWLAFNENRKTPWLICVSNPFTSGAVCVVLTRLGFVLWELQVGLSGRFFELNFSGCHQSGGRRLCPKTHTKSLLATKNVI